MNLAFFLTPVAEVAWLPVDTTVGEAIEAMRAHRYTAVPLLDPDRRYVGTLTSSDLLHWVAQAGALDRRLSEVPRALENRAVGIDTDVRAMFAVAEDQNFVPVIDSRGVMMGIVTRKAIITFFERLLAEHGLLPDD